jgi:hypothetical protein
MGRLVDSIGNAGMNAGASFVSGRGFYFISHGLFSLGRGFHF